MLNSMYFRNTEPTSADMGMAVRLVTPTTAIPVSGAVFAGKSATGTVTNPTITGANQTLLAANANRNGGSIFNDSGATVYVKCAATASSTDYTVKMADGAYWEIPFGYTGIIDAIGTSNKVHVTEYTT